MKKIFCEYPVIIRNPQLKELLITHRCYTTLTGDHYISFAQANYFKYRFPDYQFSPRRFKVTLDNIDRFTVFNEKTGEVFPMFIQVPCGKCVLCRDKKAREWSFRATCENVFSESIPLFLTLTYNNENLPKHGVFKEEVQLFLKRLRISLDRLHYKHNLRYFACAEYGSKSKRPHYHMLIWNFPREGSFRNIWNVTHFIEKCWSKITGYDGKKPVYSPIGYVYTLPCDKGAIGYVMKYMRKQPYVPKGMNPIFFLSSRKDGGLGAKYAKQYIDFYRKNPQCLDISVCDPYSGMTTTISLPDYFRRLYFPAKSTVVSKLVRDSHKKLCDLISRRYSIHAVANYLDKPIISDVEKKVLRKYWFLSPQICKKPLGKLIDYYSEIPYSALDDMYVANEVEIASLCRYLILENIDETWFKIKDEITQKRTRSLDAKFGSLPDIDLKDVIYRKTNAIKLAQLKEIV